MDAPPVEPNGSQRKKITGHRNRKAKNYTTNNQVGNDER